MKVLTLLIYRRGRKKRRRNQNKHKMLRRFTFKLRNTTFHGNVSLLRPPLPCTCSVCNPITVLKQWKRDSHIQWWCWDGPLPALSHSSALLVAGRTWPGSKQTNRTLWNTKTKQTNRTLWNTKTKLTTTTHNRAINATMNHSQDSKIIFLVNPGLSCDLQNRPRALKQLDCHASILPSTGHKKNAAQPKPAKCKLYISFFTVQLLFRCRFVPWYRGLPQNFARCGLS